MTAASPAGAAEPPSGPYDSPRAPLGGGMNLRGMWALYGLTLRQHLHGKRWMIMAALCLLPAGMAILIRSLHHDAPSIVLEFWLVFMIIPQAVLPLMALIYASGIISDEQEEQTITYLLIRPIPKWAIYTIKLKATLTTTVLLTVLFTLLTYAAIYLGAGSEVENIPLRAFDAAMIHALAVVAYCCLFGLLSLVTKRVLLVGVLYIVAIEGILANLPFGIRLITVIYYARLIAYRMLEFPSPNFGTSLSAEAWHLDVRGGPTLIGHPTTSTCLIVLLAASAVCTVVAAIICSQREFHVKTPEKN